MYVRCTMYVHVVYVCVLDCTIATYLALLAVRVAHCCECIQVELAVGLLIGTGMACDMMHDACDLHHFWMR